MTVNFTYVVSNSTGKVRLFTRDTNVGYFLNRVITSHNGKTLQFSGASFETNELVGYYVFPDAASAVPYKVQSNGASSVTIRGDINATVAVSGTSAVINEADFSDEEIAQFYSSGGDEYMAAALLLRSLAADKARLAKRFKRTGVAGIEIEQRELKQLLQLAESYEAKSNSVPASEVASFETGNQARSDEFESDDVNEWGGNISTYGKT